MSFLNLKVLSKKTSLCVILLIALGSHSLLAKDVFYKKISNKFQLKQIDSDRPIKQILEGSNHLFVLGNNYLWMLSENEALKKIDIYKKLTGKVVATGSGPKYVYLATDNELIRIHKTLLKITKYTQRSPKQKTLNLITTDKSLFWVKSNGTFQVESSTGKFSTINHQKNPKTFGSSKILSVDGWSKLIVGEQGTLSIYRPSEGRSEVFFDSNERFVDFQIAEKNLYVCLSKNIHVFDLHSLKLIKTVPVNSPSRLVKCSINSQRHGYLFANGVVEIYDLSDKSLRASKINLSKKFDHKNVDFNTQDNHISLRIGDQIKWYIID